MGENSLLIRCHGFISYKERNEALLFVFNSKLRQAVLWQLDLALYLYGNTSEAVLLWKQERCLKYFGYFACFLLGKGYQGRLIFLMRGSLNYNNFVTSPFSHKHCEDLNDCHILEVTN